MNEIEHLLTVLGEECAETIQRATKAARFGLHEVQPGQPEDNLRRLERELSEAVAVAEMLGLQIREEDKAAKREKLKKYMDFSRTLGTLEKAAAPAPLSEEAFLKLYEEVIRKAKEILAKRNADCGDEWPAGQPWNHLVGSSKSIYMMLASKELKIDRESYLAVIRNWPYSAEGLEKVEALFGT